MRRLRLHTIPRQNAVHEHLHDLICRSQIFSPRSRLAVDAKTDLHLLDVDHLSLQSADRGEGDTHASGGSDDCFCGSLHLAQGLALFGQSTSYLVHKECAGNATLCDGGHVIPGDHRLYLETVDGPCPLRSETKVQSVTSVVLDHQQASLGSRHLHNGGQHCVDGRRSKGLPRNGCGEHALANEAAMHRLVTCATSANNSDFVL
mmetsp:Transcript_35009/g.63086  ORF Transcript_35009/g.63086 Transcript_35009/m.63086 type:complete len:204 (-) Transcript_35009:430-1041(-)